MLIYNNIYNNIFYKNLNISSFKNLKNPKLHLSVCLNSLLPTNPVATVVGT